MVPYTYTECRRCQNYFLPPYNEVCRSCQLGNHYIPVEIELQSVVGAYHTSTLLPPIRRVIFNDPATIVFWADGTKTVVKAYNEVFDPEKGLAMAIAKKAMGNGRYYPEIKKWTKEYKEALAEQAKLNFENAMRRVSKIVSNATKKCDRCGIFYDTYDGNELFSNSSRSSCMAFLDNSKIIKLHEYDLCPECMEKLIGFLEGGKDVSN